MNAQRLWSNLLVYGLLCSQTLIPAAASVTKIAIGHIKIDQYRTRAEQSDSYTDFSSAPRQAGTLEQDNGVRVTLDGVVRRFGEARVGPMPLILASLGPSLPYATQSKGRDEATTELELINGEIWVDIPSGRQVTTTVHFGADPTKDIVPPVNIAAGGAEATQIRLRLDSHIEAASADAVRLTATGARQLVQDPDGVTLTVFRGSAEIGHSDGHMMVTEGQLSFVRAGVGPSPPVAVNLPFILDWPEEVAASLSEQANTPQGSDSQEAQAQVSQVLSLLRDHRIEEAVVAAKDVVKRWPDQGIAHYVLGAALSEQLRLDLAERSLRRAMALAPHCPESWALLTRIYTRQGRPEEARDLARSAPEDVQVSAAFRQAQIESGWRRGRLQEGIEEYVRASGIAPVGLLFPLEVAQVYLDSNNMPEALRHGLEAVRVAPQSGEAHAVMGLIYDRRGSPEQAQREYREALSLSPDNALARLGLGTSRPNAGPRLRQLRQLLRTDLDPAGAASTRLSQQVLSNPEVVDDLRDIAQALLRDPGELSRALRPWFSTEIAPGLGSDRLRTLALSHRAETAQGTFRDLTFGNLQAAENYRNHNAERRALGWLNLVWTPNYRTRVLGQYFYSGSLSALPGTKTEQDSDDRSAWWDNEWDLSARYQVAPTTFAWVRAGHSLSHLSDDNSDAPEGLADPDLDIWALRRARYSQLSLEGRLDHTWGKGHQTSYVLSAAQEHSTSRERFYEQTRRVFLEEDTLGRAQIVAHTLQYSYRPTPKFSLDLGVTAERYSQRSRSPLGTGSGTDLPIASTSWLPFGQVTFAPRQRDLFRAIAYRDTRRQFNFTLRPADVFQSAEPASVALGGTTSHYELDYEHRFSANRFAKLFLFRTDSRDFFQTPPVRQTIPVFALSLPQARSQGIGVRYEQKLGRSLSSYLRYTYREVTDPTGGFWLKVGESPQRPNRAQLPMIPHSQAVLGLGYVDRKGRKLFLEADWRDELFADVPRKLALARSGGNLTVNLQIGKEATSLRSEWRLHVNNLFNSGSIYWRGLRLTGQTRDFPAPGYSFEMQYLFRF